MEDWFKILLVIISIFVIIWGLFGGFLGNYLVTGSNNYVTILEWFNLVTTTFIIIMVIYIRRNGTNNEYIKYGLFGLILIYYLVNVYLNFLIDKNKQSFEKSETPIGEIWKNSNTTSSNNISQQASDKINEMVEETGFNNLYTTPLLYLLNIWVIYRLVSWLQFLGCNNPSNQSNKIKNYSLGITELLDNMPTIFKGDNTFNLNNLYDSTQVTKGAQANSEVKLSINKFDTPKFDNEICGMSFRRLYTMIASCFAILSSPVNILLNGIFGNDSNPTYPFSIEGLNTTCVNDITYYLFSWSLYLFTLFYAISVVCLTGSSRSFGIIGLVVALILMLVLFFGKVINEFVGETFKNIEGNLPLAKAELVKNSSNSIISQGQSNKVCDKCTVQGVKIPNNAKVKTLAWIDAAKNQELPVIQANIVSKS